jgi:hypothetical protein
MMPSSEMNSVTTIRPMLDSPQNVAFGLAMQASIVVDRDYGKFSSVSQTTISPPTHRQARTATVTGPGLG